MVTQQTSMAVYEAPNPLVDSVQIRAALTSHSEVSFLVSLQIPGISNPVSALIDSGATLNFLDLSLATFPTFVLEPLDHPVALCLFNGKPVMAGFIHESVNLSVTFNDNSNQNLWPAMAVKHQSNN